MLELGLIPTEVHEGDRGFDGIGVASVRNHSLGRGMLEHGCSIAVVGNGRLLKLLQLIWIHFNCVLLLVKRVLRRIEHRLPLIILR